MQDDFLVEIQHIPLPQLHLSDTNPRRTFDKKADDELTETIRVHGVLSPLLVRPHPKKKGDYEVIFGARRRRCAEDAKREKIPCIVRTDLTDEQVREMQMIENLQRLDVHPLQEAEGFAEYLKVTKREVAELAARVGKDEAYIAKRMKLADLIPPLKKIYLDKKMGLAHALILCRLTSAHQKQVHEWFENNWKGCPSATELQATVNKNFFLKIIGAPWKLEDEKLVPKAGACSACPKLSTNSPALFDDVGKETICTDASCFEAKLVAYIARLEKELGHGVLRLSDQDFYPRDQRQLVTKEKWEETTAKECEHGREGIIIHANNDKNFCRVVLACLKDTGCKKHWSERAEKTRESSETPAQKEKRLSAERERKAEVETRRRVLLAVEKSSPGKLDAAELLTVAKAMWQRTYHDLATRIIKLKGWYPEKKGGRSSADNHAIVEAKLKEMPPAELARFIMFLALSFVMDEAPSDYDYETRKQVSLPDPLMIYAEKYGVDVAAIRKEVAPEKKQPKKKKGK